MISEELAAIKDAVDKSTGDGRDHGGAVALADAYVAAHPELFTQLADMSIEDCVGAVGVFRAAGMEEDQWRVETWLLSRFEPQNIGGEYQAQTRIPGVGE